MRKLESVPKPGHLAAEVPINILYVVPPDPKDLSRDVASWDTFPSSLAASAARLDGAVTAAIDHSPSSTASDAACSVRCHHCYWLEKGSNKKERQHWDHGLIYDEVSLSSGHVVRHHSA